MWAHVKFANGFPRMKVSSSLLLQENGYRLKIWSLLWNMAVSKPLFILLFNLFLLTRRAFWLLFGLWKVRIRLDTWIGSVLGLALAALASISAANLARSAAMSGESSWWPPLWRRRRPRRFLPLELLLFQNFSLLKWVNISDTYQFDRQCSFVAWRISRERPLSCDSQLFLQLWPQLFQWHRHPVPLPIWMKSWNVLSDTTMLDGYKGAKYRLITSVHRDLVETEPTVYPPNTLMTQKSFTDAKSKSSGLTKGRSGGYKDTNHQDRGNRWGPDPAKDTEDWLAKGWQNHCVLASLATSLGRSKCLEKVVVIFHLWGLLTNRCVQGDFSGIGGHEDKTIQVKPDLGRLSHLLFLSGPSWSQGKLAYFVSFFKFLSRDWLLLMFYNLLRFWGRISQYYA